jgi:hypothetical protein
VGTGVHMLARAYHGGPAQRRAGSPDHRIGEGDAHPGTGIRPNG